MAHLFDLPHELLFLVVQYLSIKPYGTSITCGNLFAISLTSKRFHAVARKLIYKAVFLPSPRAAVHFARTLTEHPDLGLLVQYFEAGALEQIELQAISHRDQRPSVQGTTTAQEEAQRYFLLPLKRWHSTFPQVAEDLRFNNGAIWISSILSQLHRLVEVELQLGRSAQYLN
ncbi:hypothetical protein H2204_015704, partial [Knufia peltigerae]